MDRKLHRDTPGFEYVSAWKITFHRLREVYRVTIALEIPCIPWSYLPTNYPFTMQIRAPLLGIPIKLRFFLLPRTPSLLAPSPLYLLFELFLPPNSNRVPRRTFVCDARPFFSGSLNFRIISVFVDAKTSIRSNSPTLRLPSSLLHFGREKTAPKESLDICSKILCAFVGSLYGSLCRSFYRFFLLFSEKMVVMGLGSKNWSICTTIIVHNYIQSFVFQMLVSMTTFCFYLLDSKYLFVHSAK